MNFVFTFTVHMRCEKNLKFYIHPYENSDINNKIFKISIAKRNLIDY